MLSHDDTLETQASVRRANLRRALQLVFDEPEAQTRAGIARATGLTAATASSLVAELLDARLIVEGAPAASTGGKRATTLGIDTAHHRIVVVLLRPADALISLFSLDGREVDSQRVAFTAATRIGMLESVLATIAAEYGSRVLIAAVQLPGTTDGRTVLESVQLEWQGVPLAEQLEAALGTRVLLVNDVDAEALAEAGADEPTTGHRLFIHIGGGIGAAVTLGGELAPGPRHRAGEIGHVQVVFGDAARRCRCGRTGCLESAASLGSMLGAEFSDSLGRAQIVDLVDRADQRDLDEGARALARVIKLISALLDPVEVVIGGPGVVLGERFLDLVRSETDYAATGTAQVPVRFADPRIPPAVGPAQAALAAALGVRWSPERMPRHP